MEFKNVTDMDDGRTEATIPADPSMVASDAEGSHPEAPGTMESSDIQVPAESELLPDGDGAEFETRRAWTTVTKQSRKQRQSRRS